MKVFLAYLINFQKVVLYLLEEHYQHHIYILKKITNFRTQNFNFYRRLSSKANPHYYQLIINSNHQNQKGAEIIWRNNRNPLIRIFPLLN